MHLEVFNIYDYSKTSEQQPHWGTGLLALVESLALCLLYSLEFKCIQRYLDSNSGDAEGETRANQHQRQERSGGELINCRVHPTQSCPKNIPVLRRGCEQSILAEVTGIKINQGAGYGLGSPPVCIISMV